MSQLDTYAEKLRVQVPAAPPNILDGYVQFAPWVAMILGALAAVALVSLLGAAALLGSFVTMYAGYRSGGSLVELILFSLLLAVLDIVGGYLMLQRKINGWWLVSAGLVVYLLQDLLGGNLLGLLITLLVAWIHIQVKPRYSA
jgi:hypothetical protein